MIGARREGDQLVVRVADTGIGVAPGDLPYIFEPFRRADSAVKRAVEGSGLGLAITQRFVEMHGGTLELTSALGSGTTVTARFPVAIARKAPEAAVA
jgi:two-component system sensor histidine kinase BaeS